MSDRDRCGHVRMAQYAAVPAHTRSRARTAHGPLRSRRALREPSRLSVRTVVVVAAGLLLAAAAVVGLSAAPLAVLVAAAAVLCAALVRKPSGRRSTTAAYVPTVVVWSAVVALILALGAASFQGLLGTWTSVLSSFVTQQRGPAPGQGGTTAGTSPSPSIRPTQVSPSSVPAAPPSRVPTATPTATPTASATPSPGAASPSAPAAPASSATAPAPSPAGSAAPVPSSSPSPTQHCRSEEEKGLGGLLGGLSGDSPEGGAGDSCS